MEKYFSKISKDENNDYFLKIKSESNIYDTLIFSIIKKISNKYADSLISIDNEKAIIVTKINYNSIDKIKRILKELEINIEDDEILYDDQNIKFKICKAMKCSKCKYNIDEIYDLIKKDFKSITIKDNITIGFIGCYRNCLKKKKIDILIEPIFIPKWDSKKCVFCKKCEKVCSEKAITISKDEEKLDIDVKKCINCGDCIEICPKEALIDLIKFKIYCNNQGEIILADDYEELKNRLFKIIDDLNNKENIIDVNGNN